MPGQIPIDDDSPLAELSEDSAAELLGRGTSDLHQDILEEEQQRHPEAHDEDDVAGVEALAEEFHQRLNRRS
jgi:hypothetical protein